MTKLAEGYKCYLIRIADYCTQGWVNHWANTRDLALEYQNPSLLVFHVFRLFTTRRNCTALLLACTLRETDNFGTYRF